MTASATSVTSSLVLGAVKSAVGHAEPAAGAIGLLAATRAMVRRAALAMPHLREMNRHVEAALRSAVRGSSAPFRATAPRRFAAIPSVMDTNRPGDASVSAFAFQGTNAHAIVRCARDDGSRQFVSRRFTVGDATRCCAVPKPHAWLIRAAIFADEETRARFEVSLAENIDAATLWDHIVRGKALCPAAAFAEMAAQASWFAQRDDSRDDPGEDVGVTAVVSVVVPRPLALDDRERVQNVSVCVCRATGEVRVVTGEDRAAHLTGRGSRIAISPLLRRFNRRGKGSSGVRHPATRASSSPSPRSGAPTVRAFAVIAPAPHSTVVALGERPGELDAAVHLAEGVLANDASDSARVPVAAASFVRRGSFEGKSLRSSRVLATVRARVDRGSTAINDHAMGGSATFAWLELRRPRKPRAAPENSTSASAVRSPTYEIRRFASPTSDSNGHRRTSRRFPRRFANVSSIPNRSSAVDVTANAVAAWVSAGTLGDAASRVRVSTVGAPDENLESSPAPVTHARHEPSRVASTAAWAAARSRAMERAERPRLFASDDDPNAPSNVDANVDANAIASLDVGDDALTRRALVGGARCSSTLVPARAPRAFVPFDDREASSSPSSFVASRVFDRDERSRRSSESLARLASPVARADRPGGRLAFITGGTGALGSAVSAWLVSAGATRDVSLASRSGRRRSSHPSTTARRSGVVTLVRCDAASSADAADAVDRLVRGTGSRPADASVSSFHASGALADAVSENQTVGRARVASASKLAACARLPGCSIASSFAPPVPTVFACVFSSTTAVMGNAGQTTYGAANARAEASSLAARRAGTPACVARWGAWAGGGMASSGGNIDVEARMRRVGLGLLDPNDGLRALAHLLGGRRAALVVCPFDWSRYADRHPDAAKSSFLANGCLANARGMHRDGSDAARDILDAEGPSVAASKIPIDDAFEDSDERQGARVRDGATRRRRSDHASPRRAARTERAASRRGTRFALIRRAR